MKKPTFPAIVFILILWASIAIMTATIMTTGKLVVTLWAYLNPAQQPISTAAILAPIFEPIPACSVSFLMNGLVRNFESNTLLLSNK
jgi:hypothetical protein